MSDDIFVVSGTGSRELIMASAHTRLEASTQIKAELIDFKFFYGKNLRVMSGMAEGFDEQLAIAAQSLEIATILAIPTKSYVEYYWGRNSLTHQSRMDAANQIMFKASEIRYLYDELYVEVNGRKIHANFARNQYMVDNSDFMLVWDPKSRGTKDCFARIKKANRRYKLLGPEYEPVGLFD
jgi:hypothetical protein